MGIEEGDVLSLPTEKKLARYSQILRPTRVILGRVYCGQAANICHFLVDRELSEGSSSVDITEVCGYLHGLLMV